MTKSFKQKITVFFITLVLFANFCTPLIAHAAEMPETQYVEPASARNIAIIFTGNDLQLGALGRLYCYGETQSNPVYYNTGVKVELQQYDGGWNTIKTWEATGNTWAIIEKYYYVDRGYAYQLKVTHYAYDIETDEEVESYVTYSDCIRYD